MKSLAEFIIETREKAGFSTYGLANKACIDLQTLEDIESGRELFLAVTTRQKLARALKCSPNEIKKYSLIILKILIFIAFPLMFFKSIIYLKFH